MAIHATLHLGTVGTTEAKTQHAMYLLILKCHAIFSPSSENLNP